MTTTDKGVQSNPATYFWGRGWKGWADFLGTPGLGVIDVNVPASVLAAVKPALPGGDTELADRGGELSCDLRMASARQRQAMAIPYSALLLELGDDQEA